MFSRNILFHKFYFTNIVKCTCYFDTAIQKKESVLKEMEFKTETSTHVISLLEGAKHLRTCIERQ